MRGAGDGGEQAPRAVKAAMLALLETDHADSVRATLSVPVCSSRQVANTGLNTPAQVTSPNWTAIAGTSPVMPG